jgi:ferredoxin
MTEHIITFLPENRKIKVKPKTTILAAALSAGIDISGSCGGKANCGKCRVEVINGNPTPTVTEKELISEDDLNNVDQTNLVW